jgi:hypothetical protein
VGRRCNDAAVRSAIGRADADEDVPRARLCIFDDDVEIAIVVEDSGVEKLVFGVVARAASIRLHEIRVRKRALRVLVQVLHVRMARNVVEVEVILLDVLAVIAFRARETEQALLQDGIGFVPQGEREAQPLLVVTETGDAVLAPAIGARARMVVRKVIPGLAFGAVVLAHRAPLPFAQVRAPSTPRRLAVAGFLQSCFLGGHGVRHSVVGDIRHAHCAGRPSSGQPSV